MARALTLKEWLDSSLAAVAHLPAHDLSDLTRFDSQALPLLRATQQAVCTLLARAPERAGDWGHCLAPLLLDPPALQAALAAHSPAALAHEAAEAARAVLHSGGFSAAAVQHAVQSRAAGALAEWALAALCAHDAAAEAAAQADPAARALCAERAAARASARLCALPLSELADLAHASWSAVPNVLHGDAAGTQVLAPLAPLSAALCALLGLEAPEVAGDYAHLLRAEMAAAPGAVLLRLAALDVAALAPAALAAAQQALAAPEFSVPALAKFHHAAGVLAGWAAAATALRGEAAGPEDARLQRASLDAALAGAQAVLAACEARAAGLAAELSEGDARASGPGLAADPKFLQQTRNSVPSVSSLHELGAYPHVQADVMRVGHALCLLLKVQPSVTKPSGVAVYDWWSPLKPLLHDARKMTRVMQDFAGPGDGTHPTLADLTPATAVKLRALIENPAFYPGVFTPNVKGSGVEMLEAMKVATTPAGELCEWITNVYSLLPPSVLWAADRPAKAASLEQYAPTCELARARVAELTAAVAARG